MKIVVFLSLEILALVLNVAFAIVIATRTTVSEFLRLTLMGLVFVNLLTNAQCMALDLSLATGFYLGWPICFTQFLIAPFCIYATLLLVTVINVERIVAIKWIILYPIYFTRRRAALVVVLILTLAIGLSLLGLPDLIYQYECSNITCLPSDIYPRRYGTLLIASLCTFLLLVVLASFVFNLRELWKFYKRKVAHANNCLSANRSKLTRKALVASRIAFASAFLYTWTIGFMVAFLFWILITGCDDLCLVDGSFAFATAIVQLLLTIQDPLVFFISMAKGSEVEKLLCKRCVTKAGTNQVAPYNFEPQGSSQPLSADVVLMETVSRSPVPGRAVTLKIPSLPQSFQARDPVI